MSGLISRVGLAVFIGTMTAAGAQAGAEVSVAADVQGAVYFDGEEIGTTPLKIKNVDPGFHTVKVVNPADRSERTYEFYSPRTIGVDKQIDATFAAGSASPTDVYGSAPGTEPIYQVAGDTYQPTVPQSQAVEERSYEEGRRYEQERRKVRTRNTLLGAGLLNELLNKGGSKRTVRGVALGGALLNELINRGN